jgi:DNA polymerase III subunit delta
MDFTTDPYKRVSALTLLVDHIGNDLSRLSNEIDKLIVNLGQRKEIQEEDIEKYIGISREFNVFELQNAIAKREMPKAIRIICYFEDNPKAGPIQMILPAIHGFFSKTYMLFSIPQNDEKAAAAALGINPFFVRDYLNALRNYSLEGVENILLLLHEYNLRSVGVNDTGTEDAALLKEMVVKMMDKSI